MTWQINIEILFALYYTNKKMYCKISPLSFCHHTKTVRTSPDCSLPEGNVLWMGGITFRLILLQAKSLFCRTVSLLLALVFCVLSSRTWLELGPPLDSLSQIISSISALEAEDSGRTTLTLGRSPRLPPKLPLWEVGSSFSGLAYLKKKIEPLH